LTPTSLALALESSSKYTTKLKCTCSVNIKFLKFSSLLSPFPEQSSLVKRTAPFLRSNIPQTATATLDTYDFLLHIGLGFASEVGPEILEFLEILKSI
jgi:hypothetical protein